MRDVELLKGGASDCLGPSRYPRTRGILCVVEEAQDEALCVLQRRCRRNRRGDGEISGGMLSQHRWLVSL